MRVFLVIVLTLLLFPVIALGCVVGIFWDAIRYGMELNENFVDWMTRGLS